MTRNSYLRYQLSYIVRENIRLGIVHKVRSPRKGRGMVQRMEGKGRGRFSCKYTYAIKSFLRFVTK